MSPPSPNISKLSDPSENYLMVPRAERGIAILYVISFANTICILGCQHTCMYQDIKLSFIKSTKKMTYSHSKQ